MITQIAISNFAIVDQLELEFHSGMTTITGETGAGKSIILGAIGLALGDRADADCVRHGADRADIYVHFDISRQPKAIEWLKEHDLDCDESCILRRVITKEGRSRGYINNHSVPLQKLRELGESLVDVHSQHQHQSLLKPETPRLLVDEYAQHSHLTSSVKSSFQAWQKTHQRLLKLQNQSSEQAARIQLLRYQVEELNTLGLSNGEIEKLENEQVSLSQAEEVISTCTKAIHICSNDDSSHNGASGIQEQIYIALQMLNNLSPQDKNLSDAIELLNSAQIQVEEAGYTLQQYSDNCELNPGRLLEVDERLSSAYEIARKHRVQPNELPVLTDRLSEELNSLEGSDSDIESLSALSEQQKSEYIQLAQQLSSARNKAAKRFEKQVNKELKQLGMEKSVFHIDLQAFAPEQYAASGLEDIKFLVQTNIGQTAKPLHKVASGGELSRISLAIQVVTAQTSRTPTLVFDEVDVGIGGGTAETVGRLLKDLGDRGQIICVTHQPQVAAQGHKHLFVSKQVVSKKDIENKEKRKQTQTKVLYLRESDKAKEIARMLGGITITQQTIAHAQEMLDNAHCA